MTICPVAIAVGCKKCPVFKVCPLKDVIGDDTPESKKPPKPAAKAPTRAAPKVKPKAAVKKKK